MKTIAQPLPNGAQRPSTTATRALGAFDPTLPEDGALIIAEVLRDQFTALNDDIQTRATSAELGAAVSGLTAQIEERVRDRMRELGVD